MKYVLLTIALGFFIALGIVLSLTFHTEIETWAYSHRGLCLAFCFVMVTIYCLWRLNETFPDWRLNERIGLIIKRMVR